MNVPKQVKANKENVVVLCSTFNIREFPLIFSIKYTTTISELPDANAASPMRFVRSHQTEEREEEVSALVSRRRCVGGKLRWHLKQNRFNFLQGSTATFSSIPIPMPMPI